ncbi:uncharacterized protein LOC142182198 [Nicotiana tabacum]|uniref:Uncharacterized protein LOC142182198 n=1 Tax=Nicotiana tabacum TaxID=4097 RepID=A0AC58US81_TOBAC
MLSYNLQLELPASQVTLLDPLLIMGTSFIANVEQFFSGLSTAAEDRPTRDVDGGRRLSFGSSSAVAADLSQAQDSSQPITESTLCDAEYKIDAYIQESDETMVADGLTTPSTDPASPTGDHTAAHPHIKRRRDEDDPNSVPGRQGMRLRPAAALKHTGCGTH